MNIIIGDRRTRLRSPYGMVLVPVPTFDETENSRFRGKVRDTYCICDLQFIQQPWSVL